MHGDMFSYLHRLVHNKLDGNFTLTYVCNKSMLARIFHNHASIGAIKCYRTVSVKSILTLVGTLEVRYVTKIPGQRTSYSGRGFPWFFSVPSGICQYSTSKMPTNASPHKFPLSLPTVLIFPSKMFQLPVCHTTANRCYRFRPLKTASISGFY
jgi:hypothetical protein